MKLKLTKKDINDEMFWNYFKYQSLSFLEKDLLEAKQAKNEQLVNNINDTLIGLRNVFIRKKKSVKRKSLKK